MYFISEWWKNKKVPSGTACGRIFLRSILCKVTPWDIALIKFHGIVNFAKLDSSRWEKLNEIPTFEVGRRLFSHSLRNRVWIWRCIVSPVHPRAREEVHDLGSIVRDFRSSLHDGMEHGTCDCWIVPRELIATMSLGFLSTIRSRRQN